MTAHDADAGRVFVKHEANRCRRRVKVGAETAISPSDDNR
jgi:hypothetical protein